MIVASAPGKVFVSGEYAVLRGAPAVVMAIERRAYAATGGDEAAMEIRGVADAGDTRLLEAVCAELSIDVPRRGLRLDTTAFTGPQGKFGIGSSAALTVALTAALLEDAAPKLVLPRALAAHRALQGGGSGADVAASVYGGIIAYRMDAQAIDALSWPAGLRFALINTGVPSSTPAQVAAFDARAAGPAADNLHAAANVCASAWLKASAADVCTAQQGFAEALLALDGEFALGIFAAGHRQLYDAASAAGVVYKPCGAGGGDLGLALSTDEAALADFVASAADAGFERLDLQLAERGVSLDENAA